MLLSREKRGGPGVQVIIESACKSIVEEYNRACSDLENLKNELATCNQETERREIRKMIERFVCSSWRVWLGVF